MFILAFMGFFISDHSSDLFPPIKGKPIIRKGEF